MTLEQSLLCSSLSTSVGELLIGSAPQTEAWILLEYPFPYGAKALEESELSDRIKSHLASVQKFLPSPRLVLIKKSNERLGQAINLFLALTNDRQPQLFHLELSNYDELLEIDFQSYLSMSSSTHEKFDSEYVFLVCTNGKRDPCCAKFGLPLYEAISKYMPDEVWQSSHVGGHRFAGNLVCLPHGIYYGRVPPEQGPRVIDAYRNGSVVLEYFRGRASYTPAQQAAEYYLRTQTGITNIDEIRLVKSLDLDIDHWIFVFEDGLGKKYNLRIQRELSDFELFESCNTPEKRNRQSLYELQDIKTG